MEKELWFKKKKYGWGWTPSNLKGWLVILFYVVLVSAYPMLCKNGECPFQAVPFLIVTFLLTVALFAICYAKGEKPEWSWGDKK